MAKQKQKTRSKRISILVVCYPPSKKKQKEINIYLFLSNKDNGQNTNLTPLGCWWEWNRKNEEREYDRRDEESSTSLSILSHVFWGFKSCQYITYSLKQRKNENQQGYVGNSKWYTFLFLFLFYEWITRLHWSKGGRRKYSNFGTHYLDYML